jgi:hypothetical protein
MKYRDALMMLWLATGLVSACSCLGTCLVFTVAKVEMPGDGDEKSDCGHIEYE